MTSYVITKTPCYGPKLRIIHKDGQFRTNIGRDWVDIRLSKNLIKSKSQVLNHLHLGDTIYDLVCAHNIIGWSMYDLKNPRPINVHTINSFIEKGALMDDEIMLKYAISKGDLELVQYLHNVHGVDLTMCDSYAFNIVKDLMNTDQAYCDIGHYIIEHYPEVLSIEEEKDSQSESSESEENLFEPSLPSYTDCLIENERNSYMDVTTMNNNEEKYYDNMGQMEDDFHYSHRGVEEVMRLIELADRKIAFLKCQVSDNEEEEDSEIEL